MLLLLGTRKNQRRKEKREKEGTGKKNGKVLYSLKDDGKDLDKVLYCLIERKKTKVLVKEIKQWILMTIIFELIFK